METIRFLIPSLKSINYIKDHTHLWYLDSAIFTQIGKFLQSFANLEKSTKKQDFQKNVAFYKDDCFALYHEIIQSQLLPQFNEFLNFLFQSKIDSRSSQNVYRLVNSTNYFDTTIPTPKRLFENNEQLYTKGTIIHAIFYDDQIKQSKLSFLSQIDAETFPNLFNRIQNQTNMTFSDLFSYSELQGIQYLYNITFHLNRILEDMMVEIDRTHNLFMPDYRILGPYNTDIIIDI